MRKLDQERVQKAIDRAYDAEVANLFKTFLEDVIEATTGTPSFLHADEIIGWQPVTKTVALLHQRIKVKSASCPL
jgi:hypothetical protein